MGHNFNKNTRELLKLSVVHFKGSAQLTQFSLAEHKLYQAVYIYILVRYKIISVIITVQIEFSSMEQYVKGFQRFHTGEDVRPPLQVFT